MQVQLSYACHHNPLLITNQSRIVTMYKDRIFCKKFLESKEMVFQNGVVNIQAAGYNGARTVDEILIIIAGCDFIPPHRPGRKTLKITATLDSR